MSPAHNSSAPAPKPGESRPSARSAGAARQDASPNSTMDGGRAARASRARGGSMSERYGTHKNRNFTGKIFVIALAVLLLGTVAYMISQFRTTTSAQVTAVESGGEVVNNHRMQMRVDVTREDPNAASYCIVQALDYDKAEVGRREFVVPAGGDKVKRMTVDVNTRAAAHAGKVYGCSATIPEHLKVPQQ